MSCISVYHQSSPELPNKILTHAEDISALLAPLGVKFSRWPAANVHSASDADVIQAYTPTIEASALGQPQVLRSAEAQAPVEVTAAESVSFFFASGRGQFSFAHEDYVYAVLCEKYDLISIEAGVAYWQDMGEAPQFVLIRFGSAASSATGRDIASRYPRLED